MKRLVAAAMHACIILPALAIASPPPLDEAALRRRLLALPTQGPRETVVELPVEDGPAWPFRIRASGTLPPALLKRYPGLRSFRGADDKGRTLRLDLSPSGVRASVRDGGTTWTFRPGQPVRRERTGYTGPEAHVGAIPGSTTGTPADPAMSGAPVTATLAHGAGAIRHDFRLAVAAGSRYVASTGGTMTTALAEIAHAVNQANEVFETDVGVHFTLVDRNDRIIRPDPERDPFETHDPGMAAVMLIDRDIGAGRYDIGHAVLTYTGGESHVGTSCSDARDADFFATHKAAAWSGHPAPATESFATGYLIHVLGRQLGAWPTANGCRHDTLDDRAMEPGGGSTAMGYAPAGCGGEGQWLQTRSDRYFHAASIEQMQAWLASRGGRCATRRLRDVAAPWIDPESLADRSVIPARTPFVLDARVEASTPDRRLTYAWEQMDPGTGQRGPLHDMGDGPLFRSFPPVAVSWRVFPRMAAVLGHAVAEPGETLPTTSRQLAFRLTVRDNGGDSATVASADTRLRVVDTGRAFAVVAPTAGSTAPAGGRLRVAWDVAGTDTAPISCHFVAIDLSLDGGLSWLAPALAVDERNDGDAEVTLPAHRATTEAARLRVRCDWRPFFAVSPGDFRIR
ncbi:reprolysin-like metallopeptidase [Luteibacter sp. 9135]|uniref:reprolysin-like metallopeptidase n=1 Tax=Luteibacter sp. 9135 TaxID=1500893 RepID=UPI000690B2E3|nr:zinc-dependent metalloprotease family protein [Luteibacter sp. 9135]